MTPTLVISDLHLGALRSGGTTPATAFELRRNLLFGFQQLLEMADGGHVLINGDLFDATNVPLQDMFTALYVAGEWLAKNPASRLVCGNGNHDDTKNREGFSSFDFFANHLRREYPQQVSAPRGATKLDSAIHPSAWIVGHCPNQDLLDLELKKIPACELLLLHLNVDNKFAVRSDHSLNLSLEMAASLPVKHIIVGHEHQRKTVPIAGGPTIHIVGNQMPSSVADCLGNTAKYALKLHDDHMEWIQTWEAEGNFLQVDWRELDAQSVDFVRVLGNATAAEAAAVVAAISKFRQRTSALVVTNAVQIEGVSTSEMEISLEQVQSFNVMGELLDYLNEKEREVVTRLLEEHGGRA